MTQEHPEQPGKVPIGELTELVEVWRGMSDHQNTPKHNATTLNWCSDELEELVEQYE